MWEIHEKLKSKKESDTSASVCCLVAPMESSRNGDVTVTYEQALFGRRRNGGGFAAYLDLVREEGDAGELPPRWPLPSHRPHGAASRRRTYADDGGELDVFAAERYFTGAMDAGGGEWKVDVEPEVVFAEMAQAATARPAVAVSRPSWTRASVASAGSGSTANSQTVLLRDEHRRPGYRGGKCCVHVGGFLRSCSGKRSVHVDGGEVTTEPAGAPGHETAPPPASKIEWYRDLRMDKAGRLGLAGDGDGSSHGVVAAGLPPNLNIGAARVAAIGREETAANASFRRNFTLLAPVKVTVPASGDVVVDDDDDVGSESSSDLFEIKSLMIDDCPYEPSEASVQWSVVTASAAGGSVASSERGGGGGGKVRPPPPPPPVAVRQQHRRQDRPVGLLTGCVSHRAVDVSAMAAARGRSAPATTRRRAEVSRFASNGHR